MKKISILTGSLHAGKTSFVKKTIPFLTTQGHVNGFYTPKVFSGGKFIGYDLVNIEDEIAIPFIRLKNESGWFKFARFYFNPRAIDAGNRIIRLSMDADILIIDEIGPLEISGQGFRSGLDYCLQNYKGSLLLVCRDFLLEDVHKILRRFAEITKIFHPDRWNEIPLYI
ncbi:MAG: hypothetical protein HQ591_03080 [candidate division Zixibacteria bacterium]|nr:hypothetical protein [Candidatus Tariuqbacter arcticus]